jgi:hypothetical protein
MVYLQRLVERSGVCGCRIRSGAHCGRAHVTGTGAAVSDNGMDGIPVLGWEEITPRPKILLVLFDTAAAEGGSYLPASATVHGHLSIVYEIIK